jgi:hypothetical protein
MVKIIVERTISKAYKLSDLALNLSFFQFINAAIGNTKSKAKIGSHSISKIAPTAAKSYTLIVLLSTPMIDTIIVSSNKALLIFVCTNEGMFSDIKYVLL